jgi:hypothetical protein
MLSTISTYASFHRHLVYYNYCGAWAVLHHRISRFPRDLVRATISRCDQEVAYRAYSRHVLEHDTHIPARRSRNPVVIDELLLLNQRRGRALNHVHALRRIVVRLRGWCGVKLQEIMMLMHSVASDTVCGRSSHLMLSRIRHST